MDEPPHTVVETRAFAREAARCMSEGEIQAVINLIAANPDCGVRLIAGGGIRKVRFGVNGRGKSGGVRVVYYFHNHDIPIFLLTVFAKNEKSNLSRQELTDLATAARVLADTYGEEL